MRRPRLVRNLALALLAPVLVVCLYLAAAAVGGLVGTPREAGGPVRLGLLIGPIHTDLLIPLTPDVRARLGPALGDTLPLHDSRAEWLVAGWGARTFYTTVPTWDDLNAPAVLWGIVGDGAVLRLDLAGRITDFDGIALIAMDEATLSLVVDAVLAELPPDRQPMDHPGFTETDAFWPATGPFNLFRTCNVWVGEVLRAAGVGWGLWTPTPQAMRLSLWRFHDA